MAIVKPFRSIRPIKERAADIAALPYDVYTTKEAREIVKHHPLSFLRIDRAEVNFPEGQEATAPEVYEKAKELLEKSIADGDFMQDQEPRFYLYELTMDGREQNGIVGLAAASDYESGVIKRHENTRADKEEDRIRHVDALNAQTGPIFLAHRHNRTISEIISRTKKTVSPVYDFTTEEGVRQRVFAIADGRDIDNISFAFSNIPTIYIADGHHRCASAVKVCQMRKQNNPRHTGKEEYNYFLSVFFDEAELQILPYNRVVKDLNWLSPAKLLEKIDCAANRIREDFYPIAPEKKGQFSMFLDDCWYLYEFWPEDRTDDPVEGLDVSILQNKILRPILNIGDPRTDKRIDFVGGIRGFEGLEARCEKDCKIAFAMYPTQIEELIKVADAGLLMPPKSTWFEPKLLSGLFIHSLEG